MSSDATIAFIARWAKSGSAERANCQTFLSELCDLLAVPRPEPADADDSSNAYVFERAVTFQHGDGSTSPGRIDLYKRGCFVLEAKQGANPVNPEKPLSEAAQELKRKLKPGTAKRGSVAWDDAMLRARGQAEQYCRALPASEGRPPFIVVVDVGHSIELFAEFSCTGGAYTPFPAAGSHRIFLADLDRPEIRERLRLVWTAPHDLDPARRSARVTREIAVSLARLAVSLEKAGHDPHTAATFLMRVLFTMFAEDVGLLMRGGFTSLLQSLRDSPEHFAPMMRELWQRMDKGGFSTSMRMNILQFNGGLFENADALPMTQDQLLLLIAAEAPEVAVVVRALMERLRCYVASALRDAQAQALVRADVDARTLAAALFTHLEGVLVQARIHDDPAVATRLESGARLILGLPVVAAEAAGPRPRAPARRRRVKVGPARPAGP